MIFELLTVSAVVLLARSFGTCYMEIILALDVGVFGGNFFEGMA